MKNGLVSYARYLQQRSGQNAYIVVGFLLFVTLLVLGSLCFIRSLLLLGQSLPALTKLLANGTCRIPPLVMARECVWDRRHTESNSWVIFADLLTLVVGEEHVCGETTLWRIGIWREEVQLASPLR